MFSNVSIQRDTCEGIKYESARVTEEQKSQSRGAAGSTPSSAG